MTEANTDVRNSSQYSRGTTAVIGSVVAVLIISAGATLWNTPQEQSEERDGRIEARLTEDERFLRDVERRVGELELAVKELRVIVEAGTKDRFTGADWKREDRRIEEGRASDRLEVERLRDRIDLHDAIERND